MPVFHTHLQLDPHLLGQSVTSDGDINRYAVKPPLTWQYSEFVSMSKRVEFSDLSEAQLDLCPESPSKRQFLKRHRNKTRTWKF